MQRLYKPEKTWGNQRLIYANHRGKPFIYIQNDKTSTTSFQLIHPQFVHHPHLGIPGFMAVFTHLTCVGSNWMTYSDLLTMDAETLSLQIFKELLLLLEVPRQILRLLTTNLNQLVINLEVRVSCNMCFLLMGHGSSLSSCIMYHDE